MTGSPEFGYLIEAIKKQIPSDKLERAAKAGKSTMKQVILAEFFKNKSGMSMKKSTAVDNLFVEYDLDGRIVSEVVNEEKTKVDSVMDSYINGEVSGFQARREMRERGYGQDAFWDWYAARIEERRIRMETKEAMQVYSYAKRKGLSAALPDDTVKRARLGFSTLAKLGALKRWMARRSLENE